MVNGITKLRFFFLWYNQKKGNAHWQTIVRYLFIYFWFTEIVSCPTTQNGSTAYFISHKSITCVLNLVSNERIASSNKNWKNSDQMQLKLEFGIQCSCGKRLLWQQPDTKALYVTLIKDHSLQCQEILFIIKKKRRTCISSTIFLLQCFTDFTHWMLNVMFLFILSHQQLLI